MKRYWIVTFTTLILVAFTPALLAACAPGKTVESDSGYTYGPVLGKAPRLPLDDTIYTITGTVDGHPVSMRSTKALTSTDDTVTVLDTTGKGFVRVRVEESSWPPARPEDLVILKTTDTNVLALEEGDPVTFRCRAQAEAVAPSYTGQVYDEELAVTWELDFCRLLSPVLGNRSPMPNMGDVNQVQP